MHAQTKDASALAVLTRTAQALGATTGSVLLEGTAAYTAGSDEEDISVSFTALGVDSTRLVLQTANGPITETRNGRKGAWVDPNGASHAISVHNTWSSAAWFSPALLVSQWIADPELVIFNAGKEQRNGLPVQHLQCYRRPPGHMTEGTASLIAAASRMDLYIDANSFLPVAYEYNDHADTNMTVNLPVRIEFSRYKAIGFVTAPFHIQKFLQNTLLLDISATHIGADLSSQSQ